MQRKLKQKTNFISSCFLTRKKPLVHIPLSEGAQRFVQIHFNKGPSKIVSCWKEVLQPY